MLDNVIKVLTLEEVELNHYLGLSPSSDWHSVYGGQVIAQAMVAASKTIPPDRPAHSLHGYFLRPGNPEIPILYKVDPLRDGKSFTTRRVVATQGGEAIFTLATSFQVNEEGLEHQLSMPEIMQPEELIDEDQTISNELEKGPDHLNDYFTSSLVQIRQLEPWDPIKPDKTPPRQLSWMRTRETLPKDNSVHQCVLAYLSDYTILNTASKHHGISYFQDNVHIVSLDHSMWFHNEFAADEWLLYVQDSPSASGSRAFTRGLIYDLSGNLVASSSQEGLMRKISKSN